MPSERGVETFGDQSDPAIVLIAGPDDPGPGAAFAERLADGPRFVVRYGQGGADAPARPRTDQVDDLVGLLDRYGLATAHLVGIAEGGTVAERVALRYPGRVDTLTLIMTDGSGSGPSTVDAPTLVIHRPPSGLDSVVPAILRHTSGGWARQADRLAARALAADEPTGWFERLYAAGVAGEVALPWDTEGPRPSLVEWADGRDGHGRRALVVGCGLGQNSEYVARLGYTTDAFDISDTAISVVRQRFPDSPVRYRTADLLDPPAGWRHAFDLVVEVFTVQALPTDIRARAIAAVADFTAPGGTLIVIAAAREENDPPRADPPWPLTESEIDSFTGHGLVAVRVERLPGGWWRAEFHRPAPDLTD